MKVVLTVTAGPHEGKAYEFAEHDSFIVGRSKRAQFRLPLKDQYFSRMHFLVEINPPDCRLVDLASRNGTFVNGERVVVATTLHDGDLIHGGRSQLRVSVQPSAAPVTKSAADSTTHRSLSGLTQDELRPDAAALNVRASHAGLLPDNFRDLIARREQPIPGYCLVDEIGRGTMGVVYRAAREADGRVVALKTIIPSRRDDPSELRRFLREADILRQLDHPHIVRCEDIGEANGFLYFAMEYIPAMDLKQRLEASPQPFSISACVELTCQLLEALQAAHDRGFVHRDVKPSNLLVLERDQRDVVKLSDFGLARVYQASKLSGLTLTGSFGGTMGYVAPEQITAFRDCQPVSDQYSAAATLYHLLTRSFIHDLPRELGQQLQMILTATPIPIQQRRADIPDSLAAIIHQALSRDPAERFHSCAEFRDALRRSTATK